MKMISFAMILTATAALAACGGGSSSSPTPPVNHTGTSSGTPLGTATIDGSAAFVTASQHAVYTFSGDTVADQSNCTGGCAAIWPPVAPTGTLSGPWTSFQRSDGSMQMAYNGKPLYTFVNDTQPDEGSGNGVNGFSLARPVAAQGAKSAPTPMPTMY